MYLARRGDAVATGRERRGSLGDLAGFRLNAPRPTWHRARAAAGEFRRVSPDDGEPWLPSSGFRDEERVVVFYEGQAYEFDRSSRGSVGAAAGDGAILAPMPGKVTSVEVSEGEKVAKGNGC